MAKWRSRQLLKLSRQVTYFFNSIKTVSKCPSKKSIVRNIELVKRKSKVLFEMLNILLLIWIKISLNQNVIQNYNVGYSPRKPFSSTLIIWKKIRWYAIYQYNEDDFRFVFLFISSVETACIEKKNLTIKTASL